jgi:hypothetical protein
MAGAAVSGGSSGAPAGGSSGAGAAGRGGASGGVNNGGGGSSGKGGGAGKGGSASGGQASGGQAGAASGGGSSSATCKQIAMTYATELEKQIVCGGSAGSDCADRQVAAPGCSCRVFIQPKDPFAIEALSNIEQEWFSNDCQNPVCPATCTTATKGTCQSGRCVTP